MEFLLIIIFVILITSIIPYRFGGFHINKNPAPKGETPIVQVRTYKKGKTK